VTDSLVAPTIYNRTCSTSVVPTAFTARHSYASAVLGVDLSVCLSVTRVFCDKTKQFTAGGYFDSTRKGNHSSLLTPAAVGGRRPFRLTSALKVTHPFEKTPTSTDFRL